MTLLLSPAAAVELDRPARDEAPRDEARRAHVAPFQLTHLARSLRPRTGRGRHVTVATSARHRRLRSAAALFSASAGTPDLDPDQCTEHLLQRA